jgi:hypothetical protein
MNNLFDYNKFINENRIAIAWAKPSSNALKVLEFVSDKEKVTKKELSEFLDGIPEDASGKKPSMSWVRSNKKYFKYKVEEEAANHYTLTALGKRVLKSSKINESD